MCLNSENQAITFHTGILAEITSLILVQYIHEFIFDRTTNFKII